MAEVLEASSLGAEGFERRVAIKRILPESVTDESFTRMFLDEARLASRLHHGNVVAVLDYGVIGGLPFQVLELVDGKDARVLEKRGRKHDDPMPVECALHIVREVAFGLSHAHDACGENGAPLGIIHRDVSPSNVLVSWEGEVKVADFGIAFAHDRHTKTQTGTVKGTLTYMAPEQVVGERTLDRRADVFSLGCTLHTLLTGASPLANRKAMVALLKGESPPIEPTIPEAAAAVIRKATQNDPEERYQSAEEMADAIGEALREAESHDAKAELRKWLARIRDAKSEPRPAFVNELVGVVFEVDGAEPQAFRITEPPPPPGSISPPKGMAPKKSRLPLVAALAGVLVVAGVAGYGVFVDDDVTESATESATEPVTATGPVTATEPATAPEPEPEPEPEPASEPELEPEPEPATRRGRRAAQTSPAPNPEPQVELPPSTAPAFLQIFGPRAVSAQIFIDGRRARFGLNQATVGSHTITLRSPDGEQLGPYSVTLTAAHARGAPLRWQPP